MFWEVVGLERGPLNLVSTIEELLGWKSSRSDLEIREYGRRDPSRWQCDTVYPQTLALTSPTSGGRSVGIVRSQTGNSSTIRSVTEICLSVSWIDIEPWLHPGLLFLFSILSFFRLSKFYVIKIKLLYVLLNGIYTSMYFMGDLKNF
jgi:hypothetical protein